MKVRAWEDSKLDVASIPAPAPWGDLLLLKRCANGDKVAWRRLYREHEATARRFLLRLGVPAPSLDDACQDVFLEVYRYLPTFRNDCSFKSWLYRLCATQARKVRKRQRIRTVLGNLLKLHHEPAFTHGEWEDDQAGRLVQSALTTLTDAERVVFVLYELEGMSGKDIAAIVQTPEATVWRRLHYGRKKFCDAVNEQAVEP